MQKVVCHPYDWTYEDASPVTRNESLEIRIWCLNRESQPVLLRVQNFYPFIYLALPSVVGGKEQFMWDRFAASNVVRYFNGALRGDAPIDSSFEWLPKLYYYQGDNVYPFIKMTFKTERAMDHLKNIVTVRSNGVSKPIEIPGMGTCYFETMEDQIRTILKLLTNRDMNYSQWMEVDGYKLQYNDKISTIENEYVIDYRTMKPIPSIETKLWTTHPGILIFDIEVNSTNINKFPTKSYSEDVVTVISALYIRPGIPDSIQQFVYHLCDGEPIEGVHVEVFQNEMDLILAFCNLIHTLDPDILSGYNILGFDYEYLNARFYIHRVLWPEITRIRGARPVFKEVVSRSSGMGINNYKPMIFEGRITVDLYTIIRREHKLPKYGLGDVGKKFLGEGKHDVCPKEMFTTYQNLQRTTNFITTYHSHQQYDRDMIYHEGIPEAVRNEHISNIQKMTRLVRYCVQDSMLVVKLINKLNIWPYLCNMSNIVGVNLSDIFTRGQQIRCLSLLYKESKKNGYVMDKHEGMGIKIKGGAVKDPLVGYWKWVMCLDFSSLYPSIIIAHNMCYTTIVPKEYDESIEDENCYVVDFKQEQSKTDKGSDEGLEDEYDGEKFKVKKAEPVQIVQYHYRFVKPDVRDGLLPRLLRNLIEERGVVKKEMGAANRYITWFEQKVEKIHLEAKEKYPKLKEEIERLMELDEIDTSEYKSKVNEMKSVEKIYKEYLDALRPKTDEEREKYKEALLLSVVMDQRQLGIKIVANSIYGFTGVPNNGLLPINQIAMCVTYIGRTSIHKVEQMLINKFNAIMIYGDTDSVMFQIPGVESAEACNKWGPITADAATKEINMPPMRLEYEKSMWMQSYKKKKYSYALITKDNTVDLRPEAIQYKGVVRARRDNTKLSRTLFELTSLNRFHDVSVDETIMQYAHLMHKLVSGQIPLSELTIVKGVGINYKLQNYFICVFANRLRKEGIAVQPGERLDYIVVRGTGKVGERMRLPEEYIEKGERIDYFYYIDQVRKPIDQQISILYGDDLSWMNHRHLGYKPLGHFHFVQIHKPLEMIGKIYKDEINSNLSNGIDVELTGEFKFVEHVKGILHQKPTYKILQLKEGYLLIPSVPQPGIIVDEHIDSPINNITIPNDLLILVLDPNLFNQPPPPKQKIKRKDITCGIGFNIPDIPTFIEQTPQIQNINIPDISHAVIPSINQYISPQIQLRNSVSGMPNMCVTTVPLEQIIKSRSSSPTNTNKVF